MGSSIYKFQAQIGGDFTIFKNGIPYMRATRKSRWPVNTDVEIYKLEGNKLIFAYDYFEFFYVRIHMKFQDMPRVTKIARKNLWGYNLKVGKHILSSKLKNIPQKHIGDIYLDKEKIATIKTRPFALENDIQLTFIKETRFEIYAIILLLMDITSIDGT